MKTNLSVEEFLNSKVAAGVLRVLIQRDMPLPISRIAREIRSNYVTVRKHVRLLEDVGLVTSVKYGQRRLYKANTDNERVSVFKSFIEAWEGADEEGLTKEAIEESVV